MDRLLPGGSAYSAAKAGVHGFIRDVFLASDEATYITGHTLAVTGGRSERVEVASVRVPASPEGPPPTI